MLLTGSIDGTAKVWNVETNKQKNTENKNVKVPFTLNEERLVVTFEEKGRNPQVDCAIWSTFGRFVIVSISCKLEGGNSKDVSIIKVWDSYTNTLV